MQRAIVSCGSILTSYPVIGSVFIGPHGTFRSEEAGIVPTPPLMQGVAGVFVGGCISVGGCNIEAAGHAHTSGKHCGWVCLQYPKFATSHFYHPLRMHELAHILSGEGHTVAWRKALRQLGQHVPARYQPGGRLSE